MANSAEAPLELEELERLVRAAEPAALFVPPRILRRVIKLDCGITSIGLQVPHRKSYVIGRSALQPLVDLDELGLKPGTTLPPTLLLLARPAPERLAGVPRPQALVKYWRLLFHAAVHAHFEQRVREQKLTPAGIRERIHHIGQTEFGEIRAVLSAEHFLLPPRDPTSVFIEFAAVYLELRYFGAVLLPRYFPSIQAFDEIDELLAKDIDAPALVARTRLAGAPDPVLDGASAEEIMDGQRPEPESARPGERVDKNERRHNRLVRLAAHAASLGNDVRAALLQMQAARFVDGHQRTQAKHAAEHSLERLIHRLQAALGIDTAEADHWRKGLLPLLDRSATGVWSGEERFLYDLQKVCVDHERETYALDVVEWALSGGARPVKRPLPTQREVLICRHLQRALKRLATVRLTEDERGLLTLLVDDALHHAEESLRREFRPLIRGALDQSGMVPRNLPERLAAGTIVEELLDRIIERGFVAFGDLRDAVARNQLKLPDLSWRDLVRGDRLLLADRALALALDGVYRRGEFYLRWLHRFSALNFGTPLTRLLVLYLVLPFGGAFIALEGLQHLIEAFERFVPHRAAPAEVDPIDEAFADLGVVVPQHHSSVHLLTPTSLLLLGLFLFGLIHSPPFRMIVGKGFHLLWRGLRALLIDLPAVVLFFPPLVALRKNRYFLLFSRFILKPAFFTGLAWGVLALFGIGREVSVIAVGVIFLAISLLLNSRLGRHLEEAIIDWLVASWHWVRVGIFLGLYRLIMDLSKSVLEAVERFLYAVDEALRFRRGESRTMAALKMTLGVPWFFVTYFARFLIILILEPQFNPIKHFPVVTVSHKFLIPLIPTLASVLGTTMERELAVTLASGIIFAIPGIFGFLVWELKENWRLYEANRADELQPVAVGHHGETVIRLMKPGFHSGTLPKLYSKLRRAERRAQWTGESKAIHKYRDAIAQVEDAICHFVERELVRLLDESRLWNGLPLAVGAVQASSNRVRIELRCPALELESLWIAFEEHARWLLASIVTPGWLAGLSSAQQTAFRAALAGLHKQAGVDILRRQLEHSFSAFPIAYDLSDEGLVVWPRGSYDAEATYDLRSANGQAAANILRGSFPFPLPVLALRRVLFRSHPIGWAEWVEFWRRDQRGEPPATSLLPAAEEVPLPAAPQSEAASVP